MAKKKVEPLPEGRPIPGESGECTQLLCMYAKSEESMKPVVLEYQAGKRRQEQLHETLLRATNRAMNLLLLIGHTHKEAQDIIRRWATPDDNGGGK